MKVHLDCFPCFLKQSLIALRLGTNDRVLQEQIIKELLYDIKSCDTSKPPAYTTTFLHRKIRKMLGNDPFKRIKSEYNQIALKLYPSLKDIINKSNDPLWTATRLAIAGNVIDFGIFTSVDIEGTIEKALGNELAVDNYNSYKKSINNVEEILYLLDNAGEILFDRLLIETLVDYKKGVVAVVKGSPVINDATMEDADEIGLTKICNVIDNGSDAVGTILDWTSKEFRDVFQKSQLIISKGQGNFETLVGTKKKIYFLFQSKCDVVSREQGLQAGSMLLKDSEFGL
jgi:uncharacterized protein with ATP-grasp and redox domains